MLQLLIKVIFSSITFIFTCGMSIQNSNITPVMPQYYVQDPGFNKLYHHNLHLLLCSVHLFHKDHRHSTHQMSFVLCPNPRPRVIFYNTLSFFGMSCYDTSLTPKTGDHPCLLSASAYSAHLQPSSTHGSHFLHQKPEDNTCCSNKELT